MTDKELLLAKLERTKGYEARAVAMEGKLTSLALEDKLTSLGGTFNADDLQAFWFLVGEVYFYEERIVQAIRYLIRDDVPDTERTKARTHLEALEKDRLKRISQFDACAMRYYNLTYQSMLDTVYSE